MLKILPYLLVFTGVGVLYISTSKKAMERISAIRNESTAWWGAHNSSDKGDLVNMAYMDYIPKFHSERDYRFHKPDYRGSTDINLYLQGDSYTFKIPDTAFAGLNRYEFAWVYNKHIAYRLDTTRKNILVLEHAERYITTFYCGLDLLKIVYDSVRGSVYDSVIATLELKQPYTASLQPENNWLINKMFNKNINENLEYNLFNYNFMNEPRLAKAWLHYSLFKRASGNVVISKDGSRLFISETTDAKIKGSSYVSIGNSEYNNIVRNMNLLYHHYRAEGFDEVYLSVIPNPATILEPGGYNMLIPKLQNDTTLKMKCIDIYSAYKNTRTDVYRKGDTHWNNAGIQMWISAVNDTLKRWNKPG